MTDFLTDYYEKRKLEEGLVPFPDTGITANTISGEITPEQVVTGELKVEPQQVSDATAQDLEYEDSSDDGVMMSVAKGLVNGGIKAGESMSQLMAEGFNLPIKAYEAATGKEPGFRFKAAQPATFETNILGDVTRGFTQFGLQFYTGGNLLKAGKILQGGGKLVSLGKEFTKGVYADFTAFKGDEERLSNFLVQIDNPALNNVVTQYLAADKDDSDLEGRIKNVLEGGAVGVEVELFTASLRGLRGAKKAMANGDPKLATDLMNESKEKIAALIDDNKSDFNFKVEDVASLDASLKAPNKAVPLSAPISPDDALKVAERLKGISNNNPAAILDAVKPELGNINLDNVHTFEDVKGVASMLGEVKMPEFKEWSYAEQLDMAQLHGVDILTLRRYYKEGVVNEHISMSARMVYDAQTQKVTDMIMKNVDDHLLAGEIAQWGEYLDMMSSFSNIAGRTLGSHNIKTGLKRKSYEAASSFIQQRFGGKEGIEKFKAAWIASDGDLGMLRGLNKQSGWKIAADSILETWKNGILSGVKTMGVNLVGNPLNLYKEIGQRFFQGVSGGIRSGMTGNTDRVYMGESLAMLQAQIDGFTESLLTTAKVVKNPAYLKNFTIPSSAADKAERGYTRKISADNWGIGTAPGSLARYIEKMSGVPDMKTQAAMRWMVDGLGSVINTPGNLLNVMDGHSQNVASRTQRYALAYRQLMKDGATSSEAFARMKDLMSNQAFQDNIAESVDEFAKRSTFQGELGTFGKSAQNMIKQVRPLNIPILEYLVPFTKTPINIFTQGVTEVNPVLGISSVAKGMMEGGIKADEAIGRYTFGMSVTAATVMGVSNGMITGAGPQDLKQRKALEETGWRPYSLRVQDGVDDQGDPHYKYYQYNRLEPAAWIIGSVATMMETMHYQSLVNPNKERDMQDYAAAYLGALGEATMDKAFFQGVSQFFETMADPQRNVKGFMNRYAASMVPAVVRDINTMVQDTPYLRKVDTAWEAVQNRMIGGEKNLPLSRNRWGDPISIDKGWMLGHRSYFSPIGMSDKYAKPIDKEIARLAIEGVKGPDGETRVYTKALPSMPQHYIQRHGRNIQLNGWQYSRLLEIAGNEIKLPLFGPDKGEMNMKEALNHLVTRDTLYTSLVDVPERQAALIRSVMKPYDKAAKEQMFIEYPDLKKRLLESERYDMLTKAGIRRPEDDYKLLENLDGSE